jgi:peptide-methionine (R)-S-oxide reductase
MTTPIEKSAEQWKAILAQKGAEPGAFEVTRHAGTERAFTGKYEQHWADGSYHCMCCGAKLFDSETKFDAGCGWPSFSKAIPGAIIDKVDNKYGMRRTENVCAQCGAHLGHVFNDGPVDEQHTTGLRYCMNSASLEFQNDK